MSIKIDATNTVGVRHKFQTINIYILTTVHLNSILRCKEILFYQLETHGIINYSTLTCTACKLVTTTSCNVCEKCTMVTFNMFKGHWAHPNGCCLLSELMRSN